MLFNWFTFAVLGGLTSNAFNIINRITLRNKSDSTAFAWWFEVFRLVLFSVLAVFGFYMVFSLKNLILLIALGVVELFGVYTFMKMHSQAELSLSTIILNLRLVWIPLVAFAVIGEKLSALEYLGIVIIFSGLSFITSPKKLSLENGVVLAFVSSLITTILTIIIKLCSSFASAPVIVVTMSIPTVLFLPILMKGAPARIKHSLTKTFKNSFLASTLNLISMYCIVWSLSLGSVGKSSAIFQATTIVSVLFGIIALGEKKNAVKKVVGSVITILGAWLLA